MASLRDKFIFGQCVHNGGIVTHRARDLRSGHAVLIHLISNNSSSPEEIWRRLHKIQGNARQLILEFERDHETSYVITEDQPELRDLAVWLNGASECRAESENYRGADEGDISASKLFSVSPRPDSPDARTRLFRLSSEIPETGNSAARDEMGPKAPVPSPANDSVSAQPVQTSLDSHVYAKTLCEGTTAHEPSEFSQIFLSGPAASTTSAQSAQSGEFTQIFGAAPAFPKAVSPIVTPASPVESLENSSRVDKGLMRPDSEVRPAPLPVVQPAPPAISAGRLDPGEFTQVFGAPAMPPKTNLSYPEPAPRVNAEAAKPLRSALAEPATTLFKAPEQHAPVTRVQRPVSNPHLPLPVFDRAAGRFQPSQDILGSETADSKPAASSGPLFPNSAASSDAQGATSVFYRNPPPVQRVTGKSPSEYKPRVSSMPAGPSENSAAPSPAKGKAFPLTFVLALVVLFLLAVALVLFFSISS